MGKGWAKGLTAGTDIRVRRAAEAHRGKTYVRRTHPEPGTARSAPVRLGWSSAMAYAVGLIATDGCLYNDGRHISFTTNDRQLAETLLSCLGRRSVYGTSRTRIGNLLYRVQIGDVGLYRWLQTLGLTPRKSLTLGGIDVPADFLLPLVRGLLDGDGTVLNKVYRADTGHTDDYYWEYLQAKFYSASAEHLFWLRERLRDALAIDGYLGTTAPRGQRHHLWELRYGKVASEKLLTRLYEDPEAPRLERKWRVWEAYRSRHPDRSVAVP